MASEIDPIVADFVVESREHLADVENELLAIESGGADIDVDLVNKVFRAVHSIKGAAGFLGFSTLGQLAHCLENVLNKVRNLDLVPNAAITDVMLRAADTLRGMVEDIQTSNDVDIVGHVNELEAIESGSARKSKPAKKSAPAPTAEVPQEQESVPAEAQPVAAAESPAAERRESTQPDRRAGNTGGRRVADATTPAESNIRVSVGLLDSLMNLAGELVLSRNQLLQTASSSNGAGLDSVAARIDQITSELQEAIMQTRMQIVGTVFGKFPRVVRDLSAQLGKQCRLVVEGQDVELDKSIIEAIGDPLTHLVRNSVDHGVEMPDDRIKAGKPAEGTVVLRAFHQAGKVNISISDDGGGIDAERLKEKAVARGLLTQEQAREMGDREALRLIFHPGFSMAEKVTDVSGRGVGMDVVKTNIEKLGGAVGIDTELGTGTTIDVKLPLTLAIIPSLVVSCGENRFAIPQTSISELVRVKAEDVADKIERVKNAEVFRLRGNLLPLVRSDKALKIERSQEEDAAENLDRALHIIVVEAGHLRYGLVVDGLHDSEEIVVKPLGRHMQDCQCLAGATILGDGRVALILDVTSIATFVELTLPNDDDLDAEADATTDAVKESQTSLLFTNDPAEQFGIPMELVTRLERIRSDQIDSVGGLDVLQYRGTSLPLLTLEQSIRAVPRPDLDKVYVVVFSVRKREIGLIVPKLIDIREISIDVDTVTLREPGVIGSVSVGNKATRLLDLYELTRVARPEWFADEPQAPVQYDGGSDTAAAEPRTVSILLAEDSGFFRNQVTGFLKEAGYEVTGCEDGQIAWDTLNEPGRHFDMVVTDIEMPNLNGFELATRIKQDATHGHLPVIALTSLAAEEHVQRGKEIGIDDYQVKLDRERLMGAVAKYAEAATHQAVHGGQLAVAGVGG